MRCNHLIQAACGKVIRLAGLAVIIGVFSSPAWAQGTRYVPPGGSPFSPYLELYRPNPGPLNQYYQFYRPRVNLESTLYQQQATINSLQTEVQTAQNAFRPPPPAPAIGPTGVGSVYMNYSHYYNYQTRPTRRR